MLNTKYIATLIGAFCATSTYAGTAENITNLENQLNQCREEYKALVAKTNQEIKDLKAKAPGNLNAIYAEKKNRLDQKANSCKNIKANIEKEKKKLAAEIEFQKHAEKIKLTGAIDKAGPRFRCLQLRQNWDEFSACTNSLGLKAEITVDQNKKIKFIAKNISATIDETNHVKEISIKGPSFWNAGSIDDSFIMAFVKQYDVENFSSGTTLFNVTYYKGTVRNGQILIIPSMGPIPGNISIEYTEAKGGYSF